MATITTPVEGFTGVVIGVTFADGKGETKDDAKIAYFRRHGYGVSETEKAVEVPEGKPSTDWKGDQLKAYAEKHEFDLGAAKTKPEMVKAIEDAQAAQAAKAAASEGASTGVENPPA